MKRIKLLFDSLAVRTVLLVIAVVVVAEIATFSLVMQNERVTHKDQTARYIAGQVRLLQSVLPGLNDAARERLESPVPGEQWLPLRPDSRGVPPRAPEFGFARDLANELERMLGEKIELRHAGRGKHGGLWIGFVAAGERWWLVLPPPRFKPKGLPPDLWGNLGVALAALVLMAGVFVWGIVGPLRRLGDAVAATGKGRARTVTPEGPKEVRQLAEQHNTMLDQLAQSDAERREMLAGLTHDLRAPLARLRVRLALLENDAERGGLERDADDMERIVSQCLGFLRSEEEDKNKQRSTEPLILAEAVSNEVARQRELGRPVEMTVSGEVAACQVAIDHGSLQRLLDNLIDNALQYGAPPIEVSLGRDGQPGFVVLKVRDHGAGIAPEQRERALEAFIQLEPARATRGSCGLGLAIVHRIVDACGGEMTLADAPSGGLEVAMRLPVAVDGKR
ncbi:ATP-binding protein [Propionivibrio limicola]|uniref:ATP-binding protein n=1 Tax=Propionivibrio limicola TaxID=167645 RepID=UPI00129106CD|nr:ATP-binding protein [Propionivibrio limicola]